MSVVDGMRRGGGSSWVLVAGTLERWHGLVTRVVQRSAAFARFYLGGGDTRCQTGPKPVSRVWIDCGLENTTLLRYYPFPFECQFYLIIDGTSDGGPTPEKMLATDAWRLT